LMDSTRARRWRQSRRFVLNDRILIAESTLPPAPSIAADLLEIALRLVAVPDTNRADDLIGFSNSLCKLKAVRFKSWTQNELLAFWLNIYHCLMIHGWILLGKPASAKGLSRFQIRVSYLVGLRPVSLREIERVLLRIPQMDPKQAVRVHADARARQILGFCGFCRKRHAPTRDSPPRSPGEVKDSLSPGSSQVSLSSNAQHAFNAKCLPLPRVPTPSWMKFSGHHACLFLGREPETFLIPKQDLRCMLCLNRGNYSCPYEIPVFHVNRLNSELDEVARKFVAEFVHVQDRDGRPVRVDLPESCKAFVKELSPDPKQVLQYFWKFMPSDSVQPHSTTRLKFCKGNEEPRDRSELKKFAYSDPNLMTETFSGLPQVGPEFDAIFGTAQALSKLVAPSPASPTSRHQTTDWVIDMPPPLADAMRDAAGDQENCPPRYSSSSTKVSTTNLSVQPPCKDLSPDHTMDSPDTARSGCIRL